MAESTPMSRSFADQGVKLRIRKEARSSAYVIRPNDLYKSHVLTFPENGVVIVTRNIKPPTPFLDLQIVRLFRRSQTRLLVLMLQPVETIIHTILRNQLASVNGRRPILSPEGSTIMTHGILIRITRRLCIQANRVVLTQIR
jgi:hypothetical protein